MAIPVLLLCLLAFFLAVSVEETSTHCGRGGQDDDFKRIVGGEESRAGQWPWLVSVMTSLKEGEPRKHACGGSLITPQWVVSAAHCYDERLNYSANAREYTVRLGEHDFRDDDDHHIDVELQRIIAHPGFSPFETQNSNDISLLKLAHPVEFGDYVNTVCLPGSDDAFPPSCTVIGWGKLELNAEEKSPVVRHVSLKLLDKNVCAESYPEDTTDWDLTICAGDTVVGNKGTCNGDSGGPMVCYDAGDKAWVLAGIVSGGADCGHKDFPGIFTRVPAFLQWITDTIAAN